MRVARLLLATILLAASLGACDEATRPPLGDMGEWQGGTEVEALALASAFLEALGARDADAAWALLYPANREGAFASRAEADALLTSIDLPPGAWTLAGANLHDGHWHVDVELDPALVDAGLGRFVQLVGAGSGRLTIQFDPLGGPRGVLAG